MLNEKRIIKKTYNRTNIECFDLLLQQTLLELVLCCNNQKFKPKDERQINILTKLSEKIKEEKEI